jgi:hypothetical protein
MRMKKAAKVFGGFLFPVEGLAVLTAPKKPGLRWDNNWRALA